MKYSACIYCTRGVHSYGMPVSVLPAHGLAMLALPATTQRSRQLCKSYCRILSKYLCYPIIKFLIMLTHMGYACRVTLIKYGTGPLLSGQIMMLDGNVALPDISTLVKATMWHLQLSATKVRLSLQLQESYPVTRQQHQPSSLEIMVQTLTASGHCPHCQKVLR